MEAEVFLCHRQELFTLMRKSLSMKKICFAGVRGVHFCRAVFPYHFFGGEKNENFRENQ